MKKNKRIVTIVIYSILLFVIAILNVKLGYITIPTVGEMVDRQIDFITISTVFAGFSFTALGLLLGMSSEKLIELIKNTSMIFDKVGRIITSIICFIMSVVVSLYFVLGFNVSLIEDVIILELVNKILYIIGVGYLIGGIAYFVYAVYELYDLLKRIYQYNARDVQQNIELAEKELKRAKEKY